MLIKAAAIYLVPIGYRNGVIVEIETDAGISGLGEVGIAYGVGTNAAAAMAEEMLRRFVIGQDARRIELIWNTIYDVGFWTKGGGAISTAALSGIEQALWDIKSKSLGVPVYELFGGPLRERLPVYANGWWLGCRTDKDYAEAAAKMASRGFKRLKYYPLGAHDPVTVVRHPSMRQAPADIDVHVRRRVECIRDHTDEEVEIMLDFGGGLASDLLCRVLRQLEPCGISFVEEPVDPALPHILDRFAASTSIPLAAGERIYTRYGFHRLLETGAVSIVQPDVCNTGGILEARKIAAMAEVYNARVAPHNYGTELATVVSAHLAACLPNFLALEIFPDFANEPGYQRILEHPLEGTVTDGLLPIPTGPGWGAALMPDVRKRCLWARIDAKT